ncbi:hypothetical protein RDABS01_013238 [Bienertia sinuspersici]
MKLLQLEAVANPRIPWLIQPLDHNSHSQHSTLAFPKLISTNKPISQSMSMDSTTYSSILDSCTSSTLGKSVHAHVLKSGFHGHEFVETKLLQMYVKCGCLDDAYMMFDRMSKRNLYSWLAIISVHVDYGLFEDGFSLFLELLFMDVRLDFFVFPVVLKIASGLQDIELGRQIHGLLIKAMFVMNVYVGNGLIDMYGKCGCYVDAEKVFYTMMELDSVSWNSLLSACASNGMVHKALEILDKMLSSEDCTPNIISWSAVISGFAQNGFANEAIKLLSRMIARGVEPNAQTIAGVLPAFAMVQTPRLGKEIHTYITRHGFMSNPIVVNGLLDVYRKCGDMENASKLFSRFSVKNVVSFNTMIVGFCEIGDISKAKDLFNQVEINKAKRDLTTWNAMLSGYVDNSLFEEALNLFNDMQILEGIEVDSYTLGSALSASSGMGSLKLGKVIHCLAIIKGLNANPFVAEALVEMYFETKDLKSAQQAFEEVADKDMRTWNTLISGHVENGHYKVALQLLVEMQRTNLRPDIYTMGLTLAACSRLATIERGKQVHGQVIRSGYDADVYIGAALVDMYSKCGSIKDSVRANSRISKPNLISQNAMLTAYAMHGLGEEGISLFNKILAWGSAPDEVTFLSALLACVHAGKVETGKKIFNLMERYNVKASLKHYTSLVDLLSRCGKTSEAYELIRKMPMEPDSVTWGALLGGCVTCGDVKIGEVAAEKLLALEPDNTENFILLSNMYALSGRWNDLLRIRKIITDRRMRKSAGCSWIEDGNDVHVFTASDASHRRTEEIYTMLDYLTLQIKTWMDTAIL